MLPTISPRNAFDMLQKGEARLVDIRESSEYAENFIPEARLVPLSIAENYPLKDADAPEKPVIFFCRSGNRTDKNADLLARLAGDTQAWQMEGGLSGWKKEGLPVKTGSASWAALSGPPWCGFPPSWERVSCLPVSPVSAVSAFCSHVCRGTDADVGRH